MKRWDGIHGSKEQGLPEARILLGTGYGNRRERIWLSLLQPVARMLPIVIGGRGRGLSECSSGSKRCRRVGGLPDRAVGCEG